MSILMEAMSLTITGTSYDKYLMSDHWKRTREIRRNMAVWRGKRFCCEWCGCFQGRHVKELTAGGSKWFTNIEVHHLTYDRIGRERFDDLLVVCSGCHGELHRFIDRLTDKGFEKRAVRDRLAPYCRRRMLHIYQLWGHDKVILGQPA